MVERKLQLSVRGSIICVIPKAHIESAGLKPGEKVDVRYDTNKIVISKKMLLPVLFAQYLGLVYVGLAALNQILPGCFYIRILIA